MGKTFSKDTPFPREFDCRKCGEHVVVTDRKDKRTVYCSQYCEVQYWRDKSRADWRKRISQGHVTHLGRERWENAKERGL